MDRPCCLPEFLVSKLDEMKVLLGPSLGPFAAAYDEMLAEAHPPVPKEALHALDNALANRLWDILKAKGALRGLDNDWKAWIGPLDPGHLRALPPRYGPDSLPEVDLRNHFEAHRKCCDAVREGARQLRPDSATQHQEKDRAQEQRHARA